MLRIIVFFAVSTIFFASMLVQVTSIPIPITINNKRTKQASSDVPGWCGNPCKRKIEQMKRKNKTLQYTIAIRDEPGGSTGTGGQGVNCPGQNSPCKLFNSERG